ncbi:MAG: hypothetical protein HDR71_06685 [Lachnospiraceae bacterium]|nr:hypothetical protein [Lachnospiraceae bacterium]
MITDIFLSFLEISISVSLIIVLLMLLAPFLNKRYAAKWKYWIWIFIAFRLIIPFTGTNIRAVVDIMLQKDTKAIMETQAENTDNLPEQTAVPRRIMITVPTQMTAPITMQYEKNSDPITILDIAAYIWLAGCLVFLSFHQISYLCFKGQVKKKGMIVTDTHMLHQMSELKHELNIKGIVHIIKYPEAASPMMTGFLRPVLILPDEPYDPEELFFILKHELVHLKRRDVWVKLLLVMANAVHWFNPVIWVMRREASVDMELACDEKVTQGADYGMRKAYTEALLSTLYKQCTKKNLLSTQFYGGKQIMKKRFINILTKSRKKNGVVILIFTGVLTVGLGTVIGCSVGKDNAITDISGAENISQNEEGDSAISGENEIKDELFDEEILTDDISNEKDAAENTKILTIMKEGEPEEKLATLVIESGYYGYSFYLPDGEWQKEEADKWQAVANEDVHLWVAHFEEDYHIDVEQILADDGYEQTNGELVKQEEGIIYKVRLYEENNDVWCVFYCYPIEAEEGWGRELPVIADTFAIISPADVFHGYISAFDNGTVTVDRQNWVTSESEDWKPEYDEDAAAGFVVVDADGEDITYPLHEDCTFYILENHYDPTIELSKEEFGDYLTEMEYPVLWIITVEDGQITCITEQYRP